MRFGLFPASFTDLKAFMPLNHKRSNEPYPLFIIPLNAIFLQSPLSPLPSPLLADLPPAPASLPLHPPSTLFQMITRTSNIFSWRDYHRTVKYKGC